MVDGNGRPKTRKNHALETILATKKDEPAGTMEGKGCRMVQGGRWRSLIQVGNPATPSNETDRLSYLHRLASINSRGWYTHTKASTRVYPPSDVQRGTRLPAGNRPTNHPYICVLKGIPEYILHMLYCRLISNSMGTDLGL